MARPCVYFESTDIGATLTTWIYCGMWQLYTADKIGCDGYFHWPQDRMKALQAYWDDAKFAEVPNMFDWYFEQPVFSSRPSRDKTWVWQSNPREVEQHCLMGQPLADIKAWYLKHCRLKPEVHTRGKALVDKYEVDFSRTIGVTWRGTDCVTDGRPRMPIETYFPFIDSILQSDPDLRIACTAEEEGILAPLLKRYPSAFTISEFVSSPLGGKFNPERVSAASGYERGMQPALMVWFFSQCAHYVKNRSSMAAVASWLSTGKIISLAHPENLGHGFDITKAEIDGKIVPLNL